MKGLLLKDFYCAATYFRTLFMVFALFILVPLFTETNTFFLFYPCVLSGMTSMTLIAYEEREKWTIYARTLPYSKAEIVSSKYLFTLLLGSTISLIILITQGVKMAATASFSFPTLLGMASTFIPLSLLPGALLMPFLYKFGVEKGRMVYYIVIALFCGLIGATGGFESTDIILFDSNTMALLLLGASLAAYGISWFISIQVYNGKEL